MRAPLPSTSDLVCRSRNWAEVYGIQPLAQQFFNEPVLLNRRLVLGTHRLVLRKGSGLQRGRTSKRRQQDSDRAGKSDPGTEGGALVSLCLLSGPLGLEVQIMAGTPNSEQ